MGCPIYPAPPGFPSPLPPDSQYAREALLDPVHDPWTVCPVPKANAGVGLMSYLSMVDATSCMPLQGGLTDQPAGFIKLFQFFRATKAAAESARLDRAKEEAKRNR